MTKQTNIVRHSESNVRKQAEFQAFIELVGKGQIPENWEDMATALNVRPTTISDWKKLPEFQEALMRGIKKSFEGMSDTGKRDWRMWRERYSMLTREQKAPTVQINNLQGLIQINVNN